MADDIVTELRYYATTGTNGIRPVPCFIMDKAADEIERLRKLGDRLFMHVDSHYGTNSAYPDWVIRDLDAWQEVRRD